MTLTPPQFRRSGSVRSELVGYAVITLLVLIGLIIYLRPFAATDDKGAAAANTPANKPVTLVFTRKSDATCAKRVILTLDDGEKLERELPLDKPIELAVSFPRAGKLAYACSMDMVKGIVLVQ